MTSKERVRASLNHQQPDKMAIDFGSTPVTGIHILSVQKLRKIFGLEEKPVKLVEPYQMLGEIDDELGEALGVDIIGVNPLNNMLGFPNNTPHKEFVTFWGQKILVPADFNTRKDENGDLLIYPGGDTTAPPSAKMPKNSFFFDTLIRQEPFDEQNPDIEDNLEEFGVFDNEFLSFIESEVNKAEKTDKAIIANFGGTGLGDIALVTAPFMKYPKGIRDITEWYMSTISRRDFIEEIFDKQTDIAVQNFKNLFDIIGNKIDVAYICGTDFGTQDSTFCAPEYFDELWKPYYLKMNNWIHENTTWKTFKHCCGAVENFMSNFIEAGFDIVNPVQINAAGMDPEVLKSKYGKKLTFWGGGVDTQIVLSQGTAQEVYDQVMSLCNIFAEDGGFIFNAVHNIQANVPIENLEAMVKAMKKFNGE